MPVILKCLLCGSLFDRDVYAYCPQCGGAQTQPAFKVDYSGTGYTPKGTGGSTSSPPLSSPLPPPPPTPSPFHLLPSPPQPTFTFSFGPPSSPGGPPPTPSTFSFGSLPSFSFGTSSTSSPPTTRPKSKRFTHQLVIAVLTGTGDSAIENIANDLQSKHPDISSLVHIHLRAGDPFDASTHRLMAISTSAKAAIQNATKPENQTENAATVEKVFRINLKKAACRLYLVAHGDDGFNFAGLSGSVMAALMKNTVLGANPITCISVVSCYGAGYIPPLYNKDQSKEENESRLDAARRAPMDKNAFAAVFHRELKRFGLVTEVLARRANITTAGASRNFRKETRFDPGFSMVDASAHKAPWSKFRFYWEGEQQKVAPVYSDGDTSTWPQDLA
ncbi:hypothetical protein JYK02_37825 [Corallococcus macrosporus]|uniref:Caspase family protein n=1 Tax=Corallococcus macrosporus TaxID=35 RepID=A0ABS3DPM1_9BACT|nr:hypothetical protein [Corallococcus macrosporus]MBN8233291.1 hypothetical protein [Corallococcus macrosporus]